MVLSKEQKAGRLLCQSSCGDNIVVSGISGRFPKCADVGSFEKCLRNKESTITTDMRWIPLPNSPKHYGVVGGIEHFDSGFFGVHFSQSFAMDPNARMLLEHTFEAIVDAGYNPQLLRGSKIGVFIASNQEDLKDPLLSQNVFKSGFGVTGCMHSMLPHWISYSYGFEGPSIHFDTACSGTSYSLEHAYKAIAMGECEAAIVGGSHLNLCPFISHSYFNMGILCRDGRTKSFDAKGDGFVKSEAQVVVLLQKEKSAKRIYAKVVHAKTSISFDNNISQLVTSAIRQEELMNDVCIEANVDANQIYVLEAHAAGTAAGDPIEITAIDKVFCKNRINPLFIGSVKSLTGHTEAVAGSVSLVKLLLGMENNCLYPNLHFETPFASSVGLKEGRMNVVTDLTPWPDKANKYAIINSLGIGGANGVILLERFLKRKTENSTTEENLPYLVCVSGRSKEAVEFTLQQIVNAKFNREFIRLIHEVFGKPIECHLYRGYAILNTDVNTSQVNLCIKQQPLYLVIGSIDTATIKCGQYLFKTPLFQNILEKINQILLPMDLFANEIISSDSLLKNSFVYVLGNFIVQIALIDFLNEIGIYYTTLHGELDGIFVSTYANKMLSLQEAVTASVHYAQSPRFQQECKSSYVHTFDPDITKCLSEILSVTGISTNRKEEIKTYFKGFMDKKTNQNFQSKDVIVIGNLTVSTTEIVINLTKAQSICNFLSEIAKTHNLGYSLKLEKLYPHVEWPVSVGTKTMSSLIKWDHTDLWTIPHTRIRSTSLKSKTYTIVLAQQWDFLKGHVVDGRNVVPATAYIVMAWECISFLTNQHMENMNIVFENIKFHEAVTISEKNKEIFQVSVIESAKKFEVTRLGNLICTGHFSLQDTVMSALREEDLIQGKSDLVLDDQDLYKFLSLRGYEYSNAFRQIKNINLTKLRGNIVWDNNWITFLDNMLQTTIFFTLLGNKLYVPIGIGKIIINAPDHLQYVKNHNNGTPVFVSAESSVIRSGYIEITETTTQSIKRKTLSESLVLETYQFVPFESKLTLSEAMRVITQIVCENFYENTIYVSEMVDEVKNPTLLALMVSEAAKDLVYVRCKVQFFSKFYINLPNIQISDETDFYVSKNASLVIVHGLHQKQMKVTKILENLNTNGMLLSREQLWVDVEGTAQELNLEIVSIYKTDSEKLVLLHPLRKTTSHKIVNFSGNDQNLEWLPELQKALQDNTNVLLYSEDNKFCGLPGFFNCLKREHNERIKSFVILDNAPTFDIKNAFYLKQYNKQLSVNVFKNGKWGTYRKLLLKPLNTTKSSYISGKFTSLGDFSSFQWEQKHLNLRSKLSLIQVHYCAVNFKAMIEAAGRLKSTVSKSKPQERTSLVEFSGVNEKGIPFMGATSAPYFRSIVYPPFSLLLPIPQTWSIKEAATVPSVYATVTYSLLMLNRIKKRQSILIHSACGGVGQAAINVATYHKWIIFVTVGSEAKKNFILTTFPQIPVHHIGCSRDTSFESMVLKQTKGRGVDIILNSLTDDKLLVSLRCLANGGRFFEIGKYDAIKNSNLDFSIIPKNGSYYGVMLDIYLLKNQNASVLSNMVLEGIKEGFVKPIHYNVFPLDKVSDIFHSMSKGESIGKNLIELRTEDSNLPLFDCVPRPAFHHNKSYIIIGGLGGIGLELTKWLIKKGAKNIILSSRKDPQTGYQKMLLRNWKYNGATVLTSTSDATTENGCLEIINTAQNLGIIDGIFNLALVLKDRLIQELSKEGFAEVLDPKVAVTRQLDKITRKLCTNLRYFVMFSSAVSAIGNEGQTNYGLANSIVERICEERKKDGFTALAIQWGIVGDVGKVAASSDRLVPSKVGKMGVQPIKSFLKTLRLLLLQNSPVVSSLVIKKDDVFEKSAKTSFENITKDILGIVNLHTVSLHANLVELGVDSVGLSILKQHLENKLDIYLPIKSLRSMTLATLKKLIGSTSKSDLEVKPPQDTSSIPEMLSWFENIDFNSNVSCCLTKLPSFIPEDADAPYLFLIPGLDGTQNAFNFFENRLNAHTYCLENICSNSNYTINEQAASAFLLVENQLKKGQPFIILGYSLGGLIALELASLIEKEGYLGTIVLFEALSSTPKRNIDHFSNNDSFKSINAILSLSMLNTVLPWKTTSKLIGKIVKSNSLDKTINALLTQIQENKEYSNMFKERVSNELLKRLHAVTKYKRKFDEINSNVKILRSTDPISKRLVEETIDLKKVCKHTPEEFILDGNHLSILKNPEVIKTLNEIISNCC